MNATWLRWARHPLVLLVVLGIAATLVVRWWRPPGEPPLAEQKAGPPAGSSATGPEPIEFPRSSWQAAGIELRRIERAPFAQSVELTGKIAMNEDRVAHIFPLVDGRVDEVKIRLGDKVKKGDLLVVVQSKEVGQAMLLLFQDRMQRDFARTKDEWTQMITTNAQAMIGLIRQGATIEEIEQQLANRPIGDYRDKLMSAYIGAYKARKQLERLSPLSQQGAVTGRQLLEAESEWNAARTTMQSLVEQVHQDAIQAAKISAQAVRELETRVAVDETNLKILGFDEAMIESINPIEQGEAISYYPIVSPFDGTIVSKDVVLLERVGPTSQILSIADLTTVWVTTDIYEEHLPLLSKLDKQTLTLRSPVWPGKKFEARIFYTGDVVHESTRTVSMRAIAENHDGLLTPGMFVNVELPTVLRDDVLQAPLSAILDHEGKSFVFVHREGDHFERRDVTLGMRNTDSVEIVDGLQADDELVVKGGFALKSRMLAELLAE